jgi:hypothetical protein
MATKSELEEVINNQKQIIKDLEKKNDELINIIKNQNIDTCDIELNVENLHSELWQNIVTNLIITTSKKCGILNKYGKNIDWLDIKPSVFYSKIIDKYNSLITVKPNNPQLVCKLLAIRLYMLAYQDEVFQKFWRRLD